MSILLITAGSKFFIGAKKVFQGTDFVEADFTAEVWTEIMGHTNLAGAGDTSETVTSNQIGVARTRKGKGPRNAGSRQIIMDLDPADAGQIALIAAEKTRDSYAFKVEFPDAPAGGTPTRRFYTAFVMSADEQYDEASSVMKLNATLELDSNLVRVAAAEAP